MAIKLRSIQYKYSYKIALVFVILLLMLNVANMGYTILLDQEAFFTDDYYETNHFQQNYLRLSHNVVEKYLDLVDENTIIEERRPSQVDNALARLSTINDNLNRATSFEYVLINTETSELITNIKASEWIKKYDSVEDYIKHKSTVVQWDKSGIYFPAVSKMSDQPFINKNYYNSNQFGTTNVSASDVVFRLSSGEWKYYTAVNFDQIYNDLLFGNDYTIYKEAHLRTEGFNILFLFSGILLFMLIVQLCFITGKENERQAPQLAVIDYIPLEIQTAITSAMIVPFTIYMRNHADSLNNSNTRLVTLSLLLLFMSFVVVEFISIIRLIKTTYILKNPIVFKIVHLVTRLFFLNYGQKSTKIKVMIIAIGFIVSNVMLAYLMNTSEGYTMIALFALLITLDIGVAIWLIMVSDEIYLLVDATHQRAEGMVDYPIDEAYYKVAFKGFASDLNALQSGLQVALEEAIKGEKLKTELITNVSHDLKNPLTSIVSYIDLLNKKIKYSDPDQLNEEERIQLRQDIEYYLDILSDKSYRLKTLIEDLVSASKASSGNMEVDLQVINIRQLIQQCIGEKESEMSSEDLDVVLLPQIQKPLFGVVDPNHMYRVFDNLLSNIVKYSMRGTRVYIHIDEIEDRICITFKNISNHALEIDTEELKKRFVRGDRARTTEGSGLGLSIVESLLILQNGSLELSVDGDLYKATVCVVKGELPQIRPVEPEKDIIS